MTLYSAHFYNSSYSKCAVKVAFNVKTTCHCVPKLFGFHLSFLSKFVAEVGFNVNIKCNFLVKQVFLPFQITPNLLYMWLSIWAHRAILFFKYSSGTLHVMWNLWYKWLLMWTQHVILFWKEFVTFMLFQICFTSGFQHEHSM